MIENNYETKSYPDAQSGVDGVEGKEGLTLEQYCIEAGITTEEYYAFCIKVFSIVIVGLFLVGAALITWG